MRRLPLVGVLLVAFAGPVTWAQDGSAAGKPRSDGATTTDKVAPEAPIGHRQPRAGDLPSQDNLSNPNDAISREDAALDRRIKSICRGC